MPRGRHQRPSQSAPPDTEAERRFATATAALRRGDLAEAERLCRALLKSRPKEPALLELLGAVLMQKGENPAAVQEMHRAIEAGLRTAGIHNNLAIVLERLGRNDEAVAAARTAARLKPQQAALQVNLANRLRNAGQIAESIEAYGRALALDPDMVTAHVGLGNAYGALGEREAAVQQFHKALERRPGHVHAFYHLALTAKAGELAVDAALAESFRARAEQGAFERHEAALAHNALGHVFDRQGDYDRAFRHFRAANEARRAERAAQHRRYDAEAQTRQVDQLIEAFPAREFAGRRTPAAPDRRSIFIVGMPRSGTTLVEQILSAHSEVAAGGELLEMAAIAAGLTGGPAAPSKLAQAELDALAERYRAVLRRIDPDAARVTDKLPQNFLNLGLVAWLFPEASVVHCRRDPLDTCLSCYFQHFAQGNAFADDLADLGAFYRDYRRLMDHWRDVLPLRLVEVDYESLVRSPEAQIRRLLEGLDLGWQATCLDFAGSRDPVLTASQWQVRQPISTRPIERWRRYREHLGPLIDALGDLA
jgi:tetratricopeptide (TPR) repeat protein